MLGFSSLVFPVVLILVHPGKNVDFNHELSLLSTESMVILKRKKRRKREKKSNNDNKPKSKICVEMLAVLQEISF